jgi:large subunit ribosomal protein L17
MRHAKGNSKLSKPTDQRVALLRSLALSLMMSGKIKTSKPRAKEARKLVEKIVGLSKKGGIANLRRAVEVVPNKKVVAEFFKVAPERFKGNAGGVCRIVNIGSRRGDDADMVLLELIA